MIDIVVILSVYIYDDAKKLKEAVRSIELQTFTNWHLLVGLDGPVNENVNLLIEELSCSPKITVLKFKKNRGLAYVLNDLISFIRKDTLLSKASYIARMDADDICSIDRFEYMLKFMNMRLDVDVAGSNSYDVDVNGNVLYEKHMPVSKNRIFEYTFLRSPLIHPSVFFRSYLFLKDNIEYSTNGFLTEDLLLWCQLLKKGYRISNLPRPLIYFTVSEDTYYRRTGLPKAISELKARLMLWRAMKPKKYIYIVYMYMAFLFKLLPVRLMKIIDLFYKSSKSKTKI